jgi:exosortase/archaeosortase family protein
MPPGPTAATRFALQSVAWSLGIFGALRLTWAEAHVVLPFTRLQAGVAAGLFGTPASPVEATLACSGADALALCLGAILGYPVRWRARLTAAAGGFGLIVGLNTLRIGTLGHAAASPAWFNLLHLYVWPAVLTLAIAGYVFGWMRLADGRQAPAADAPVEGMAGERPLPTRRFVGFTALFLVLFAAAAPLYLESTSVLAAAGFVASAAAAILGAMGVSAHAAANVLWTPRGGFLVTQECVSTPLIPVYLAAVCAYATTWWRLIPGLVAAVPLFTALAILRLLVVALPEVIASPLFVVHAFYQLLLGAVVVLLAALWRHGRRTAAGHALAGISAGVLFVYLLGPVYTRLVYQPGAPLEDPQGAIAFLPAFQIGLYLALWAAAFVAVGWRRLIAGAAILALTQTAVLLALHTLATHASLAVHVRDVRGWAVAGPLLIVALVVNVARPRH